MTHGDRGFGQLCGGQATVRQIGKHLSHSFLFRRRAVQNRGGVGLFMAVTFLIVLTFTGQGVRGGRLNRLGT